LERRLDVTAAIFGLIGVVIGAVINGAVTSWHQRRVERSDFRSAARLVRSELVQFRSLGLEAARRPPEHLPQLQDATPILWQSNRGVLARSLSDQDWNLVARAYAHVDALTSVLVFEPDGTLIAWRSNEAQRLLAEMIEPVEAAAVALRQASDTALERAERPPDVPEFPEGGPVAA
jgi:hypothetical protein